MTDEQNEAETLYRLGVILLDYLLSQTLINADQYDRARTCLAHNLQAPLGLLEAEDMQWKKELYSCL